MDSFDLFLPSKSSYPDPDGVCHELVLNGDAEGNGFNPYPMENTHWYEGTHVVEENGNKFWRLVNRNDHKSSIQYRLDTFCLTRGTTYKISSRVRYHHSEGFVGGSEPYYWYILYRRPTDNKWAERSIVQCDAQSVNDGWVTCSGTFMISEDLSLTSEALLRMGLNNWRDGGKYNVDFDDITLSYYQGYVDEFVVDSSATLCWGSGADVHVTSATYYNWNIENGFVSQIDNIIQNNDGTTSILLKEATTLPVISKEDDEDDAVELVLLSRNIKFEGDDSEDEKGGYMQILHTLGAPQLIQGIEFKNFGRLSEADRFVSNNGVFVFTN